jgi:leucyl-tRNA synthetase
METYNFKDIESKWQKKWFLEKNTKQPNYYVLSMLPYPSGRLHMGHLRNYCIGDVIARFKTLQGFKVLHPIGWDAFGLPAENAAIENKTHPKKWTLENIAHMKKELISLGFSFNWEHEITTCLPDYYKHEQKMFLDFLKNGIAYKKESLVNYDPVDKTVLANEQVIDGKGWRSGAIVEKRMLSQWFLKVSDFAEDLLDDLGGLRDWPEKVKTMQQNWIGKSIGAEVNFKLQNGEIIKVFTTRPDTLFGASFIAIAPSHPFALSLDKTEIKEFIDSCNQGGVSALEIETSEKRGIFTGHYAVGLNDENLPVYIANFVLMEYGTGAVFGCPAHDERDFEFAVKYNLPIKKVVSKFEDAILETERFYLRPFKITDFENLSALHTSKEVMEFMGGVETPEKVKEVLERYIKWHEKDGFSRWAVFDKKTNEFIGRCGPCYFDDYEGKRFGLKNDIEIGYAYKKEFWGKGVASEVLRGVVNWVFENKPEVSRIIAATDVPHKSSQNVLKKVGFEYIGNDITTEIYGEESFFVLERYLPLQVNEPFTEDGFAINSKFLNGLSTKEAKEKMIEYLEEKGIGKAKTTYRLKDWGVSRQRYWGCPIPVIYCKNCGMLPVPEKDLPINLPEDIGILEAGENPLQKHPTWKLVKCHKCNCEAERETDTLDTFFESSWYFLRYKDAPHLTEKAFENPLQVNDYIGGIEHAILHLLYARFFVKALKKCGYDIPFNEPFKRLITQGMVCHKTYKTHDGKWITPEEAAKLDPHLYEVGDSIKMSKSKRNLVEPSGIVERFGADTARLFMMSDTPPEKDFEWNEATISSTFRFLSKFWQFALSLQDVQITQIKDAVVLTQVNKILKTYSQEVESFALNKAVAKIRELSNMAFSSKEKETSRFLIKYILIMLFPFSPHLVSEIASRLKEDITNFPFIKSESVLEELCNISLQVNGKLRGVIEVKTGLTEQEVEKVIMEKEILLKYLNGKEVVKRIYIPNKIFSFVVKE